MISWVSPGYMVRNFCHINTSFTSYTYPEADAYTPSVPPFSVISHSLEMLRLGPYGHICMLQVVIIIFSISSTRIKYQTIFHMNNNVLVIVNCSSQWSDVHILKMYALSHERVKTFDSSIFLMNLVQWARTNVKTLAVLKSKWNKCAVLSIEKQSGQHEGGQSGSCHLLLYYSELKRNLSMCVTMK